MRCSFTRLMMIFVFIGLLIMVVTLLAWISGVTFTPVMKWSSSLALFFSCAGAFVEYMRSDIDES